MFRQYGDFVRASPKIDSRLVVLAARVVGRALYSVRAPRPTPEEVAQVLSHVGAASRAATIAREIAVQDRMNGAVLAMHRARGPESLFGLVERSSLSGLDDLLQSPAATIVLCWRYVGPPVVLAAAIHQMNGRGRRGIVGGLLERQGESGPPPDRRPATSSRVPNDPTNALSRTAGLWQLAQHLKSGGIVGMNANDPTGSTLVIPCMGRTVEFGRGAFVLSRLTGAPIVPIMKRWTPSRRAAFVVGPPLQAVGRTNAAGVDHERLLAIAAARWIESRISETPDALRPDAIFGLLGAPPAATNA